MLSINILRSIILYKILKKQTGILKKFQIIILKLRAIINVWYCLYQKKKKKKIIYFDKILMYIYTLSIVNITQYYMSEKKVKQNKWKYFHWIIIMYKNKIFLITKKEFNYIIQKNNIHESHFITYSKIKIIKVKLIIIHEINNKFFWKLLIVINFVMFLKK